MSQAAWLAWAWPLLAGPCAAAVPSEDLFLADLAPVLTASRLEQSPLDAPAPVTVIDRQTIADSGFTEIHDVFRLVPGFLVAEWPEGSPVVVNHGLGDARSRRLQVLVDGRSVFNPLRGGVDWQDLPLRLEDIERIEVVRAPNQAGYGANAFQGVVNIITREPGIERGGAVVLSAGRLGFSDAYFRFGGGDGVLDWRLSASDRDGTLFRDLGQSNQTWDESVGRQTLNARLAWRPEADVEWWVQLGLAQGSDDVGTGDPIDQEPMHARDNRTRFLQLAWKKRYGAGSEYTLQYYHYDRREREAYLIPASDPSVAPVPVLPVDLGVDMDRDDIEFQQTHVYSETLRGLWGLGLRHDQAVSEHYLYGLGTEGGWQWQLFGNLDWQAAPRWRVNLGGMLERHYYTDPLFSPRLALNYTLAPGHALRLSGGRGYRAPNIQEMHSREVYPYSGGIADVGMWSVNELAPEVVDFRELGYVGQFPELHLQVDARLFLERYDGYVDVKSCSLDGGACPFAAPAGYERPLGFNGSGGRFGHHKAFYPYNSGGIEVRGGDLTLDWRHPLLGRFLLAYAVTSITAEPATDKDVAASAPLHSTSLLWSRDLPGRLRLSAGYYHVGDMKWPNDGDLQWDYERIDLKLARRLGPAASGNEVALTLQNVNERHTEFDDYLVERQAFVTLRLGWN